MIPPERTYSLRLRDSLSPTLEIFQRSIQVLSNNLSVTADVQIPKDRILILLNLSQAAKFTAGAGNSLTSMDMAYSQSAPTDLMEITSTGTIAVAVNTFKTLNWNGELWIPAAGFIRASAGFNTADPSNLCQMTVMGLLIPRGDVLAASN